MNDANLQLLDATSIDAALLRSAAELLDESGQPAIVLDLASLAPLNDSALQQIERWCRNQPCPIVGLGSEYAESSHCADVVVETAAELTTLLRRLAANPQAATVLVQVLRTVEHLSPLEGLVVESLAYATLQTGPEFQRWLTQYRAQNPAAPVHESGPAVLVERQGDELALVLNRPQNSNAYTTEMRDALLEAFQLVALDRSIQKAVVTANGRCFCTGGELTEFGRVGAPIDGHLIRSMALPARLLLADPGRYHFHVHKACIGSGIEIPACAGYLTAAPKTTFWLPELTMGLIPGAGGCVSVSRRIGRRRTAYLVMMNKKIDAAKALDWGLIDAISDGPETPAGVHK